MILHGRGGAPDPEESGKDEKETCARMMRTIQVWMRVCEEEAFDQELICQSSRDGEKV